MTSTTLTTTERRYLAQAAAAPDGTFELDGKTNPFALATLLAHNFVSRCAPIGQPGANRYRITEAGQAALAAAPAPDVPQVKHEAVPVDDLSNGKTGELNIKLDFVDKWRRGQGYNAQLIGYRFRWDGDYGGWKLASPKPGAPVFQSRRFLTWLDYLTDYQVHGIEALKPLEAPSSRKGMPAATPDAQAPLWPASAEPPQTSAEIAVSTPDDQATKPGHVADRPTPKRDRPGITGKPGPRDSSGPQVSESSVTDKAAPAKTAVAVSSSSLASNAAPEEPAAAPESGRWLMDEVHQLSSALIKFTHSIGEDQAMPGVLKIHLFHKQHEDAALIALQAALPPGATITGHGPGEFYLVKRPTPAAPPSAPPVVADVAGDKRAQRPVTHKLITPTAAIDDSNRDMPGITPKPSTPAARHPRPRTPGDPVQATCAQCGKPFAARRSDAKTCSPTCRKAYSRRAADLRKAYDEARRALAEIGARLRKYPDLVESATGDVETLAREAARLIVLCQDVAAAN